MFWICCILLSASAIALTDSEELKQINKVAQFYGERAGKRVNAWHQLINDIATTDESAKLAEVNSFFNQLIFIDDIKLWGKTDYWATPLEFLGAAAGDCEDFSIAKYFTLRELGIADNKLRLVYVKALNLNQFHMVVAYYPTPSAVPLLLDNLNGDIKPANERPDLLPIYSFNGSKLWLMKQKGQGQLAGNSSRLSLWNDLRQRSTHIQLHRPNINFDK
ncbi:transglutaminase-like cysteine peptidase [Photobacterium sp.]|uniref:transglutaminase-like cysteine peptidase n=1 Tax=Photobacterium sp. TaxID=660 RepID=UPI00299F4577|nr:transglutaminase-like cysteine peptidase [Photobacterium sp.]MDX1302235.1 transglutaminase-like cysteine peptidase [Photobacterium sp.]